MRSGFRTTFGIVAMGVIGIGLFAFNLGRETKVCPDNKSLTFASRQDNCSRCWRCETGVCCESCE